jgi:hypothetical protein
MRKQYPVIYPYPSDPEIQARLVPVLPCQPVEYPISFLESLRNALESAGLSDEAQAIKKRIKSRLRAS